MHTAIVKSVTLYVRLYTSIYIPINIIITIQPHTSWVRVPLKAKTFMWGDVPTNLRFVGGSTHTYEYSDIPMCGGPPPPVIAGNRHITLKVSTENPINK